MTKYLSKFKFGEKFDRMPNDMELDARGGLRLENTKVDMIPAGLRGTTFVYLTKKPRYIAPDFDGIVVCYDPQGNDRLIDMDKMEIKAAQARYIDNREMVEKPRYIENEDGSLSLCSLPTDMHIFHKLFEGGYFLDLTSTSVSQKQKLGGFKDVILYPKKAVQQEFSFVLSHKIANHRSHQKVHSKTKIYE